MLVILLWHDGRGTLCFRLRRRLLAQRRLRKRRLVLCWKHHRRRHFRR